MTVNNAMPMPKKTLSTIAMAVSSLMRLNRRIPIVHRTPVNPARSAPSRSVGSDRPLPGCASSTQRKARAMPGSEAWLTTSPTRDLFRSNMKVPTVPAPMPSRMVPSRTVLVLYCLIKRVSTIFRQPGHRMRVSERLVPEVRSVTFGVFP